MLLYLLCSSFMPSLRCHGKSFRIYAVLSSPVLQYHLRMAQVVMALRCLSYVRFHILLMATQYTTLSMLPLLRLFWGILHILYANAPSFVEYMQLIAMSSYQQMKNQGIRGGALGGHSAITKLVKVFCSDLDSNFSYAELEYVGKKYKTEEGDLRHNLIKKHHCRASTTSSQRFLNSIIQLCIGQLVS